MHLTIRHVMDDLACGPTAGPVWRVQLSIFQTCDGLAHAAWRFGNFMNPGLPVRGHDRFRRSELPHWVPQVFHRSLPLDLCIANGTASNKCRIERAVPGAFRSRVAWPCASLRFDRRAESSKDDAQLRARCVPPSAFSSASRTRCSVSVSTLEVASSRIKQWGSCANARAKLINCFCPVEYPRRAHEPPLQIPSAGCARS